MINPLPGADWVERLSRFNRLYVGFSGGLDSSVLLASMAAIPSLKEKITAVHINHQISPNASAWQAHCQAVAKHYNLDFYTQTVTFDKKANIEEAARKARYAVFSSLIQRGDALILGHHLDDQAETLLLHLVRGAGIEGLAGMPVEKPFAAGYLLRPFLDKSRAELESYAKSQGLRWIEDESNLNADYSRNYLRQELIPQLRARWPGVVQTIARTASHCQEALVNLDALAHNDCPALKNPTQTLALEGLMQLPRPQLANILRSWLRLNNIKLPSTSTFNRLLSELIEAPEDALPCVSWGKIVVRRYQHSLYLDALTSWSRRDHYSWSSFPDDLCLDDKGAVIQASQAEKGAKIPANAKIELRFRQGGEKIVLHGQHKELKKLFQDWKIPPWLRDDIPLIYVNDQLAVIVGYAVSDLFYAESGWRFILVR